MKKMAFLSVIESNREESMMTNKVVSLTRNPKRKEKTKLSMDGSNFEKK